MGKWEPTNAGDFCCHLSKWRLWCASRVFHDWLGIQSWWFISIFTFNLDIDWGIYLNVQEKKAGSWKHVAKRGKSLCHVDGAYEAVGIVVYNNSLEDPPADLFSANNVVTWLLFVLHEKQVEQELIWGTSPANELCGPPWKISCPMPSLGISLASTAFLGQRWSFP